MVGEPGVCSTEASIVTEPVPTCVLALVPAEFGLEPSECARPDQRVGETLRKIRLFDRCDEALHHFVRGL